MNKSFVSVAVAVVSGAFIGSASAAGIDVTSTVTAISDQAAPIALVGGAVLAIMVAVKAFRWVRAALS